MNDDQQGLSAEELGAQGATALPDKEVVSILDLNADINLAIDAAAPIDLAVAANANIAAPIDASVGANVLSVGSTAGAESLQAAEIHQGVTGDATATADQNSAMNQTAAPTGDTTTPIADTTTTPGDTSSVGSTLDGNLLNVNVDLTGDLNLAAPIDGAVAANANVAAPIDAAVSANVGSVDSDATAISHQSALITQDINGDATATADQTSTIDQ
jgi:hypothetical protein